MVTTNWTSPPRPNLEVTRTPPFLMYLEAFLRATKVVCCDILDTCGRFVCVCVWPPVFYLGDIYHLYVYDILIYLSIYLSIYRTHRMIIKIIHTFILTLSHCVEACPSSTAINLEMLALSVEIAPFVEQIRTGCIGRRCR